MEKRRKIIVTVSIIVLALFSFVLTVLTTLQIGVVVAEKTWVHWRPSYERLDISTILSKSTLDEEDYDTLYRQTGIAKAGIDDCIAKDDAQRILRAQDAFFATVNVRHNNFAPYTYMETTDCSIPLVPLQDGDILITAATRFSFFRYGHSALVVDAATNSVLESVDFTSTSKVRSASIFANYSNFIVLRPKLDEGIKASAVEYAKNNLVGLQYSLTAGIFGAKYEECPTTTQCAHLVWSAYRHCGIDLDKDGGIIKPQDFLSGQVEVVQVYGFDLDSLWR